MTLPPTAASNTDTADMLLVRARELRPQDPAAALQTAQRALAQARQLCSDSDTAAALQLCADLHHDLSEYERALALADAALQLQRRLGDLIGAIDVHETLGKTLEKLGRADDALTQHEQALRLAREVGDAGRTSKSLLCLGILRYNAGDYLGAVQLYRQSLDAALSAGNTYAQGRAQGCLGNAFERMGDYARSLQHHQQCLQLFDQASFPRERSFALNNIGNVYLALGEHQQAVDFHTQSLALKRRLKDRWGEGSSLQNLGCCHLAMGQPALAQPLFEQSLLIAKAIADREGICSGHLGLGDAAALRADTPQAIASYRAALDIAFELGQRYEQVAALLGLGKLYRQADRPADAGEALRRALALTEDTRTRRLGQQVLDELSSLCEQQGDFVGALAHLREAYGLEREVFSDDLEDKLRYLTLHFELERADQEKELHRLRHVELARVNDELRSFNEQLARANQQKEVLLRTLQRQKRQLHRQSTRDALTGLYNRRHFDQELVRAFKAARRNAQPLSVVLCDIDDFKRINDRLSHQMGDEVLKALARLLARYTRRTDVVARYGGEEFALLMPGTPAARAQAVCEKLRLRVAAHDWAALHPQLSVTLSMGVSDDLGPEQHEQLMAAADQRLYRAKHQGKNRVVV